MTAETETTPTYVVVPRTWDTKGRAKRRGRPQWTLHTNTCRFAQRGGATPAPTPLYIETRACQYCCHKVDIVALMNMGKVSTDG